LVKKNIPNSIILTALDGGEAIKHWKEQPDLILMDTIKKCIQTRKLEN
jgi:CheY-like chemotaxis protein